MNHTSFKIAAAALAVASALSSTAYAGGFQLTEQSALALGRAYAGVGVDGTDVSGMYYNAATMTLHPGTQVQFGGVGVGMNLEYVDHKNPGEKNNGRDKEEIVPHGFISHQINDSTWVGLAITVPYGLATDYGEDWNRKDHGYKAEMTVINFNPNVAWKATDTLSIGAGLALQYVDAKFGVGYKGPIAPGVNADITSTYEATDFTWGFNVGLMWQPVDSLRLGLSYRSETKHSTNGDVTISGTSFDGTYDASVTVSGPAWAMATAAWDVNDYLSLYATFRWADWSSFDTLKTNISNLPAGAAQNPLLGKMTNIQNGWKDTYLMSVGYDLRVNSFWTLRGGIAYETSPIDDKTKRTAIIPDADRWWFAIGSSFHWTKDFQTDIGFAHLHGVHERSLYDSQTKEEIGRYRHLDAYLLGVQMQYRF
ncbi:OmpP1/FadL family transporter [Sutterella wadsworthensis]|uniref:OmpP1/FadL family transporter n=2 Tax=Sutterella wadsworthensis TaxID=40545 RepID=UPI003967822D